uniref:Ig-like domain-containing protein n=1 Tax=Amazona collaria TaxID=241587 RepID=A0A8B9G2K7_9PSIT
CFEQSSNFVLEVCFLLTLWILMLEKLQFICSAGSSILLVMTTLHFISEIIWTKNKDKVAEWEGQNTTYFTSFRDRSFLNEENGCLTIFNLQNTDAGVYVLEYLDTQKESSLLTFTLAVLPPPSKPEASCNDSGDTFALKCTADFPKPLLYTWKLNGIPPIVRHIPEVSIPKKDVGASTTAVCFIKFSQTEKSSEISLTQCFSGKKGNEPSMGCRGISAPLCTSMGCRGISAPLCTSMGCRGISAPSCTSMGCRGVFALVPGAPALLPPSSLILVSAGLFLLHILTPLSAVACLFLPFLK